MILVAVGTHHQPFERLLRAAVDVARETGERVVVQRGCSRLDLPGCEVHDELAPERFAALLAEVRVVVLHAGSSSFLEARASGRIPIVVPRRPEHGEHVDDHQVRFAASLGQEAVVVEPEALVRAVLDHREPRIAIEPDARSHAFCERFEALAQGLLASVHSRNNASRSGSR